MTQRILGPGGSKKRRLRLWWLGALAALAFGVFFVSSAFGVLPGSPSKFESGNDPTLGLGNEVVNTAGNKDWISVVTTATNTPYVHLADAAASTSDDSFTPGQKQDTTCPTTEGHKNPPKDDFTDVASYTETSGAGATYLYGATVRYAANGNASENIELKQGTSGLCAGSTTLLARTPGDKLLAIDYLGGGSAVSFHVLTWIATGACNVANDPAPCWGATVLTLNPNDAEGGVSTSDFTVAQNPISGVAISAGQFAEFGVNLATSGILPAGTCSAFAQTIWESRSSGSSFVSSTKDISIENKTISNCGEIKIIKHSNPRGVNQAFSFTSTIPASSTCVQDTTPVGFSLNDTGNAGPPVKDSAGNTEDCTSVPSGSGYTVTEGANPANFTFGSVSCDASGTGTSVTSIVGKVVTITLAGGGVVTCTYINDQLFGAIKITKTSSKGLHPGLAGATFSIKSGGNAISGSPFTSGADGTVCVDHLAFGTYAVQETAAPTGYAIDDSTSHNVTVNANSTCGDGNEATFSATDTPLTDVVITATGEAAPAGTTNSQITCVDAANADIGDSPSANTDPATVTANGLEPGTYTCTVVIDP